MEQITQSEIRRCQCQSPDSVLGHMHGPCTTFMLTWPRQSDGRFSEKDARRLSAAWNVTRQLDLETLERLQPLEPAFLKDEDFVKEDKGA